VNYDNSLVVIITVTCILWAPSSGDHLFTCGAIYLPPHMTRAQCYNWTKPDTLQFKWKTNHSRAMPVAAKCTLLFCFSDWKRTTGDVIFMDWVKKWHGVLFESG